MFILCDLEGGVELDFTWAVIFGFKYFFICMNNC